MEILFLVHEITVNKELLNKYCRILINETIEVFFTNKPLYRQKCQVNINKTPIVIIYEKNVQKNYSMCSFFFKTVKYSKWTLVKRYWWFWAITTVELPMETKIRLALSKSGNAS